MNSCAAVSSEWLETKPGFGVLGLSTRGRFLFCLLLLLLLLLQGIRGEGGEGFLFV